MGKYIDSPWGEISGKLADEVGGKWKNVKWTRKRVMPTQRGTLELYKQLKQGLITPDRFSYKQFNIRRLVFQNLGYIARKNLATFTFPIWGDLVRRKHLALSGMNLFVKANASTLWASMPQHNQEYDPVSNCPDMSKMLVADGDLEPISALTVLTYDPISGNLTFVWDHSHSKNGADDDYVYVMAFLSPIVNSEFAPTGYLYGNATLIPPVKRSDGTIVWSITKNLTASNIVGYVFCRDKAGIIGFSPSVARQAS